MRPPIQSRKHYVQWTITPVAVGTTVTQVISKGTETGDVNASTEIVDGSVVKAVYVELWVIGQSDSASGNFLLSFYKQPGDASAMTQAEHVDLHAYLNKKNVFYHTQGISNDGVANATPIIRQWIKIPKGKQRQGLGDKLALAISTQAEAINFCGFATYKEYS